MTMHSTFDTRNLARLEALLLAHPVALNYFQGILYDSSGNPLRELVISDSNGMTRRLDANAASRLFMIPDGSLVSATHVNEMHGNPGGLNIRYSSLFLQDDEQNSIILYHTEDGTGIWIDALYVQSIMLAAHAPRRLMTVAFGFMAIAAYRLGFRFIDLYAASRGPLPHNTEEAMVGYAVWPKFGFDAEILPVELQRFPHRALQRAATIQDVRKAVPGWWEAHGSGRAMSFDLTANSRSWSLLLNYLYVTLQEDLP